MPMAVLRFRDPATGRWIPADVAGRIPSIIERFEAGPSGRVGRPIDRIEFRPASPDPYLAVAHRIRYRDPDTGRFVSERRARRLGLVPEPVAGMRLRPGRYRDPDTGRFLSAREAARRGLAVIEPAAAALPPLEFAVPEIPPPELVPPEFAEIEYEFPELDLSGLIDESGLEFFDEWFFEIPFDFEQEFELWTSPEKM